MKTKNMIKYIAYCRKSTDEKDKQVLSIEAQIAELKEFAKRENLIVSEFITEAKTAKVPGRKQFEIVLKKIEKGEANGILSWHPDRLARNSIDGGKIIYLLDTGKLLDLKFPSFWFESTPQGKFMLSIAFGQSKYYVDNLSENVKRGNRQKLRNGVWPSKAPYGYLNNPKTRGIDIDEEKSKVVKKAFHLFAEGGRSFVEISKFLHKFGIKKLDGEPVKVDQVKNMLTNRFYLGIMNYAGEYYQGTHKTFISKKLFDEVQKQIEKIERPRNKGHDFAFSGLATCGECGAAITAETHTKIYPKTRGEVEYIYYRCTKKLKPCNQRYVNEPELEGQLRQIVRDCGLHGKWEPYFEKWIAEAEEKDKLESEVLSKKLNSQVQETETKLNRLLDGYLDQVIEPEIYKQKKNELFDEKLKLTEKKLQVEKNGNSWLEPVREFVNCALQAQKIARAKNNCHDLSIMAKKVGSNFFLMNRRLSADLNFPFAALASGGGVASAAPNDLAISQMVHPERIENLKKNKNFADACVDLQRPESVQALSTSLSLPLEGLFAVVNCSGIVEFESDNTDNDIEIWGRTIATNLSGNYYLAKVFYKDLCENGRFIMISSTDANFGGATTASYAASKSGVNSLTKSLSLLFQKKKIRVNSIAPGWVETPMTEINGEEFLQKTATINPLGRNAKPVDVGNLIMFLLSDDANYINGQVIPLEGGYTNQDPTLLLEEKAKS